MDDTIPQIRTYSHSIASSSSTSPSFHFHLTYLKDTLFIWVGTGKPTPGSIPNGSSGEATEGSRDLLEERKLGDDWAVAMPSRGSIPVTATPVLRSGTTDVALPMSQRLARKFSPHQIHLSLSLPPSLTSTAGPTADPNASRSLLVMEKQLVKWLDSIVSSPP